jgi:signal transduction histidine kinase
LEASKENILKELVAMSQALAKGDYSWRVITNVDDSDLSRLCQNLNSLADQLQLTPLANNDVDYDVVNFIDIISSYANRDFSKKLIISESKNILDAIATGVNILGEELQHTTVSKEELEAERDQLKIAKEVAENANKVKAVFLGNLSHEIRTPLQGIIGFAEILQSEQAHEKRIRYTDIISKRANDLMRIIEDLLDLSVIESGEVIPHPHPFCLHEAIDKAFNDFREDKRISSPVTLVIKNNVSVEEMVNVDPSHLRQVIFNLLNNSIKFTREGSIELSSEKTTNHFCIKVSDSGIGIAPSKHEVIFEPFRQAHEGFSRSKDGIGLGLPICKKRVEMWGGTISVESEPDKGSIFSFTIPFHH